MWIRLAPKLHKGLILLDGVTQQALRNLSGSGPMIARKPSAVQQALQLTRVGVGAR
jgi:hypothetical protein